MKRKRSKRPRDGVRSGTPPPEPREAVPAPLLRRDLALGGLMIAAA